ncbi:MAG TPA: hypothetical protein VKV95_08885 [Terriglobia bacterium]|nr:hypothetical protein [Terriglobia bacterium]
MKIRMAPLILITLAGMLPQPAAARKPFGQVQDAQGLAQIHSFCIDLNGHSVSEVSETRKFLERENSPGKVLAKLGWQYVSDCSKADATIKLTFIQKEETEQTSAVGTIAGTPMTSVPITVNKVDLTVVAKDSVKPLYSVEGESSKRDLSYSINSPYSKLERDLKVLGSSKH